MSKTVNPSCIDKYPKYVRRIDLRVVRMGVQDHKPSTVTNQLFHQAYGPNSPPAGCYYVIATSAMGP
eukprot:2919935-Pyramimonas_sp.AAC.1